MKKTMKNFTLILLFNLCCPHLSMATPSILDDSTNPIHQKVAAFNATPDLGLLTEINAMGKISKLDTVELTFSRGENDDLAKPFDKLAEIAIQYIPFCFCGTEYANFPLREEVYRQFILFFANFPVTLPAFDADDEYNDPKIKLANMCRLYWTLGQKDTEIRVAISKVKQKYELEFTEQELKEYILDNWGLCSTSFYSLAMLHIFWKMCINWRYTLPAGAAACAVGGMYVAAVQTY